MMRNAILFGVVFSGALGGCTVQTPAVTRLAPDASGVPSGWEGEGFVYALPFTVLRAQYLATRTEFEAPKCHDESPDESLLKQIGLTRKDLPRSRETALFALSNPVLTWWAEPDPGQIFRMESAPSRLFADSALLLKLGESGLIQYAEVSAQDQLGPMIAKTIEVAASLGAASLPTGAIEPEKTPEKRACEERVARFKDLAAEVARWPLSPFPKDTYDAIIASIREEQSAIRNLFIGVKSVTAATVHCDVRQRPGDSLTREILDLYPIAGLRAGDDVDCRIPPTFIATSTPGEKAVLSLHLEPVVDPLAMAWRTRREIPPDESGFFYRVPAPYYAELRGPGKTQVPPTRLAVAQLGSVQAIERAKGRNPKLTVDLYPDSGAIKSVAVEHNAPDAVGMIGAAGAASTTVLGAIAAREEAEKAARAAEAAKNTPLALLQQEQAMLQSQLAIYQAREALRQYEQISQ